MIIPKITTIAIIVPHPEPSVSRKLSPLSRVTKPIIKAKISIPIRKCIDFNFIWLKSNWYSSKLNTNYLSNMNLIIYLITNK